MMHNGSTHSDTQQKVAASRRVLRAGSLGRYMASIRFALFPWVVALALGAQAHTSALAAEQEYVCPATIDGRLKGEAVYCLDLGGSRMTVSGRQFPLVVTSSQVAWDFSAPTPNGKASVREVGAIERKSGSLRVTRTITQGGAIVDRSEIVGTCPGVDR